MRWLLLTLLTFAWAVQVEAFNFGTVIGQYNAASEAAPAEWTETFENSLDHTWQGTPFTYATSPAPVPLQGSYSAHLQNGVSGNYLSTYDFTAGSTIVVAFRWSKGTYAVTTFADFLRLRASDLTTLATITMKTSEISDVRLGTETGTDLGDVRPDCSSAYWQEDTEYFMKIKAVQDATASSDELYVWTSDDGSSWSLCYSATNLTFPDSGNIENVSWRIGNFDTDEPYYIDEVKMTFDGSDTSDY